MDLFNKIQQQQQTVSNKKTQDEITKLYEDIRSSIIELSEKAKKIDELKNKSAESQSPTESGETTDKNESGGFWSGISSGISSGVSKLFSSNKNADTPPPVNLPEELEESKQVSSITDGSPAMSAVSESPAMSAMSESPVTSAMSGSPVTSAMSGSPVASAMSGSPVASAVSAMSGSPVTSAVSDVSESPDTSAVSESTVTSAVSESPDTSAVSGSPVTSEDFLSRGTSSSMSGNAIPPLDSLSGKKLDPLDIPPAAPPTPTTTMGEGNPFNGGKKIKKSRKSRKPRQTKHKKYKTSNRVTKKKTIDNSDNTAQAQSQAQTGGLL
jgi:hypothetical protein